MKNKKIILSALGLMLVLITAFQTSPYARRIRPFSSTPVACQENEIGYNMTSHVLVVCTNSGFVTLATGGSSGTAAPTDATYITKTANATLSGEFALGTLSTGILKNATTTGIPSIAVAGVDYESPLTFTASDFDRAVNTISTDYTNGQAASGAAKGFLTSADWTTFNSKESVLTFNSPLSRSTNTISCTTCALTSGTLAQFASTTSSQLFGIISDESGAAGVLLRGNLAALATNDVLTWNGTNWINQVSSGGALGLGGNVNMTIANSSSTGTTANRLAKLTGAPSTALITATSDTENAVGICTSGCGTTGSATIAVLGQVNCDFDNATTAGNYVTISAITAGKCHDAGSTFPTDFAAYGRVLSTNGASGTFSMELMTPDIAFQNAGNGKSKPGGSATQVQYNNSGVFAGANIFVEDANTFALRNSTTSQTFRVHGTFTSPTSYEGIQLYNAGGGFFALEAVKGSGGGTLRSISVRGSSIEFKTGASLTNAWDIGSNGSFPANMMPGTDAANDIGDNSHRVRNIRGLFNPVYTTGSFTKTTNTSLADVTSLTRAIENQKRYYFEAILFFDADATGGHKYAIASSGAVTTISYHIDSVCDATSLNVISSRQTSSGGSAGQAGCVAGFTKIIGSIKANANGNLTVQFAQNASSGSSSILINSTFRVELMDN